MSTAAGHQTTTTQLVSMIDVDAVHIHFAAYFRWMDMAYSQLLCDLGHPLEHILESGHGTPVVDARCDYRASVKLGDRVTVVSTVESVGRTSYVVRHEFTVRDSLTATGAVTHVWTSPDLGAALVPEWIRGAMAQSTP